MSHSSLSLCWSHEFSPHLKSFTLSFQPLFKWFCFWVCVLSGDSFCLWWVWWQISIERLLTWGDASSVSVSGPDVFAVWKEVCKKLQWFIISVTVKPICVFVSLHVFSVIAEHTGGIPEESFGSLPEVRTELWCSVFFFYTLNLPPCQTITLCFWLIWTFVLVLWLICAQCLALTLFIPINMVSICFPFPSVLLQRWPYFSTGIFKVLSNLI